MTIRDKDFEEKLPLVFDFTDALGEATINSLITTAVVSTGSDINPESIFLTGASISDKTVVQWLKDGVIDTVYHIRCKVITSDTRTLVGSADIGVISR